MRTLVHNIGRLCGILPASVRRLEGEAMSRVESIEDAWLEITDCKISGFGSRDSQPELNADEVIDAEGGYVMPTFCDSHTHIVFACTREAIERSL